MGWVGGWVGEVGSQLLMPSPELLKPEIPISGVALGGGGDVVGGQFLMLSPEILKSQIPISGVGVGGRVGGLAANF